MEKATYTIPEVAAMLRISKNSAYVLARTPGGLPGVIRLGGSVRVTKKAIDQLLEDANTAHLVELEPKMLAPTADQRTVEA